LGGELLWGSELAIGEPFGVQRLGFLLGNMRYGRHLQGILGLLTSKNAGLKGIMGLFLWKM